MSEYSHNSIHISAKIHRHEKDKFRKIQKLDGLGPIDFFNSLNISSNIANIFKAGQGVGQSGSFFFYSFDNKFIIKTLRGNEKKNLLKMLDDLIIHYEKT